MNKYILCAVMISLFSSCIKDNGNYNYAKLDEVTVTGLGSTLRVFLQDPFEKTPIITSTIPEENREYCWRISNDTLCRTKTLSYTFSSIPSSAYPLVFEIRNKLTNVRYATEINIEVVSPFQKGWAIISEKDNKLQMGLVAYDRNGQVYNNLYNSVNNENLQGEVYDFKHMSANPSGSLLINRMVLLTSENSVEIDGLTMQKVKNYDNEFKPSMPARPEYLNYNYYSDDLWMCLIAGGKAYAKKLNYNDIPESGVYEVPLDADEKGVDLAPTMEKAERMEYYLAFDKKNHRYVYIRTSTYNQRITSLRMKTDAVGLDPDNVDGECLKILRSQRTRAVSIVKTTTGKYQIHLFTNEINWTLGVPEWTLLGVYEFADGEIDQNTLFETHGSSPYLMYTKGKELKALNLDGFSMGSAAINSIKTYSGKITAIKHAYSTYWNASYDEFAIAIQPDATPSSASLLLIDPLLSSNGAILKQYDNVGGDVKAITYKY